MTKVLAVDDDPVIQRLLQVNLEMEGYDVELASDGEEAIARVKSFGPDIVLLDIMMPKKDGWQVCEAIKGDPATKHIPVVFLSARAQDADVQRGNKIGAEAYITKPFDPIDLLDLVADLTGGSL